MDNLHFAIEGRTPAETQNEFSAQTQKEFTVIALAIFSVAGYFQCFVLTHQLQSVLIAIFLPLLCVSRVDAALQAPDSTQSPRISSESTAPALIISLGVVGGIVLVIVVAWLIIVKGKWKNDAR